MEWTLFEGDVGLTKDFPLEEGQWMFKSYAGWWFQRFFSTCTWNDWTHWLFFKWVETTKQFGGYTLYILYILYIWQLPKWCTLAWVWLRKPKSVSRMTQQVLPIPHIPPKVELFGYSPLEEFFVLAGFGLKQSYPLQMWRFFCLRRFLRKRDLRVEIMHKCVLSCFFGARLLRDNMHSDTWHLQNLIVHNVSS